MKRRRHTPEQIVRKLREVEPVAGDISIYGQESNYTTWRMARMNLAIRGIESQIEQIVRKLREVEPVAGDISIYGQESNYTTWRMARMNLGERSGGSRAKSSTGTAFTTTATPR